MSKRRGHNEGSIYQRKDGRWVGTVDLGWEDGRRLRKSVYAPTRAEVATKLTKLLNDDNEGLPATSDQLTLGRFIREWLEQAAKPNIRLKTYYSYEQLVRTHIVPGLGKIRLSKLTPQDIQRFLNRKQAAGLSPRTCAYLLMILRRSLAYAERWRQVPRNVARLVDSPRIPQPEMNPYTESEARALLAEVKGDRLEAIYTVAIGAGLRRGEALGLAWSDVDFEDGTLTVRHQLQRVGGKLVFSEPKTKTSLRTIALPNVLLEALKAHRVRQLEERLAAGPRWHESDLVFTTGTGTPVEPQNVLRHFHSVRERAGLRHQRFHDLRHCTGSLLIAQGVNPRVVQEILGHSTPAMTARYLHVVPELVRDAANRMDQALGGALG